MRKRAFTALLFIAFSMPPVMGQSAIHSITASKLSSILKITSDKNDNLYLYGLFSGTLTLGENTFSSTQGEFFLCRTDPSYRVIWTRQIQFFVRDMKTRDDKLFVLGQYKAKLGFQGIERSSPSDNFFFACLNRDGGLEWLADGQSNGAVYASQFDMDGEGNAYVLCTFKGAVTLENQQVKPGGSKNAFLAKYNRQGKLQWVRHLTGGHSFITGIVPHAVCYDAAANLVLVGGEFSATCTFDAVQVRSRKLVFGEGEILDGNEAFIARYTPAGVCTGVKSMATDASLEKIITDREGNIYFGGHFTGAVSESNAEKTIGLSLFGTDQKITTTWNPKLDGPSEDGYIVKFDKYDNFQWIARCRGGSTDCIVDFVMGSDGTIYACGFAHVEAGFSGPSKTVAVAPVQGTGEELYKGDLFVVKINQAGDPEWFRMGGGKGIDKADSLCLTSNEVKIAGSMSGLARYDNKSLLVPGKYFNGVILSSQK